MEQQYKTIQDIPEPRRSEFLKEREELQIKWRCNTRDKVLLVNKSGTRYFLAIKKGVINGVYYGHWSIRYGEIRPCINRHDDGSVTFEWKLGGRYKAYVRNGVRHVIPEAEFLKADVMGIAKRLGFETK